MTRRQLRETTFCLLFLKEFHPEGELHEQISLYLEYFSSFSEEEKAEVRERVEQVAAVTEELDSAISAAAKNWTIDRIDRVDLVLLRLAYFEMFKDEHVPVRVAINEAVELAKIYGQDKSSSFINGVLAKLSKELPE